MITRKMDSEKEIILALSDISCKALLAVNFTNEKNNF